MNDIHQPPTDPAPAKRGKPILTFFGGLMIVVGALIAFLAGACTLLLVGPSITSSDPSTYGMASLALVIGGVPFLIGVAMVIAGVVMVRTAARALRDASDG